MIVSLLLGFMTHHYINPDLPFCNKIYDKYGTIQNSYAVVVAGNEDFKAGMIIGKDSACADIQGPVFSLGITKNISVVAGAYNTNFDEFQKLGIKPKSINGVTPILGIDYSLKLSKNVYFDTVVSVGIITHAIRVDL